MDRPAKKRSSHIAKISLTNMNLRASIPGIIPGSEGGKRNRIPDLRKKITPMEKQQLSTPEILQRMLEKDHFSRWLGLQIDEYGPGYCRLHFRVTETMLNGFSILHGGALFAASDSALAFACNSHGIITVALDCSISFTRSTQAGELLTVEAKEVHLGNKIGIYDIRTTNEKGELVALFKGTAYRTSKKMGPTD